MKIDEVIMKLEECKSKIGNVEVHNALGMGWVNEVTMVKINEHITEVWIS